jgi:hypothetical protein
MVVVNHRIAQNYQTHEEGRKMRSIKLTFLTALMVTVCGCAYLLLAVGGASVGVATYAYLTGDLKIEYPRSYDAVWDATMKALRDDLSMTIEEHKTDKHRGKIKARQPGGKAVKIKVKRKGSKITLVKIRVGTFGNKESSISIMEAIDRYLGVE